MANPMKGEAEVALEDGRKLKFVFDVNAWIDVCDELGMEMDEVLAALRNKEKPPGLKFQRVLIWGGLRKHHPEMTVRDAGEIMLEAASAMEKAMVGGMPQADEEGGADPAEGPTKSRKAGAGTRS
jgi:hypothetical protein